MHPTETPAIKRPDPPNTHHQTASAGHLMSQTRLTALVVALLIAGCQSTANDAELTLCQPTPGMSTTELAECGCFTANIQSRYAIGLDQGALDQQTQDVAILNYYCPLGSAGMARVTVVNGFATEVFQ